MSSQMTPSDLVLSLSNLIDQGFQHPVMIWGAPGIGKSSIVKQVAEEKGLTFIDLRLSQLAPTDLRGVPGINREQNVSEFFPPNFLPREGRGILFLDELNMAPPAMQGMAQQLILDRRVGDYKLPDGWFIMAAGNRKEDRASVYEMPSPVANRFIHFHVIASFESFKPYALKAGIHETVLAFLSFRPALLHKIDPGSPAWPSPRSWEVASNLIQIGQKIGCAVGDPVASEYEGYCKVYSRLPNLEKILNGKGGAEKCGNETDLIYATVIGLSVRSQNSPKKAMNAMLWLIRNVENEWAWMHYIDACSAFAKVEALYEEWCLLLSKNPEANDFVKANLKTRDAG